MDPMVRIVRKDVTTDAMLVTRSMVFVIEGVDQAGRETTVNEVMHIHNHV